MTRSEALRYIKMIDIDAAIGAMDTRRAFQTAQQLIRMVVIHSVDKVDEHDQPARFVIPSTKDDGEPLVVDIISVRDRHPEGCGRGIVDARVGDHTESFLALGPTATILIINVVTDIATTWYQSGERWATYTMMPEPHDCEDPEVRLRRCCLQHLAETVEFDHHTIAHMQRKVKAGTSTRSTSK